MGDAPTELMKYELDVTDVEMKLARLNQLLEQGKAKRATGEDTSELQVQISREADALSALGAKEVAAASGAEELTKRKGQLISAVRLAGGSFGPLVGQLGSMISLLMTATPTVAAFAAALAAVGAGAAYMRSAAEAAERAAVAQQKLNDAVREAQLAKLGTTQDLAEQLEAFGARAPENIAAAVEMVQRLRETWGVSEERARRVAPLAVAGRFGPEEAAVLDVLAGGGVEAKTPQEAQALLAGYRERGQYAQLLALAEDRRKRDLGALAVRAEAMAPTQGGPGWVSPVQQAYEALKKVPGGLAAAGFPEDLTFAVFQNMLRTGRPTDEMAKVVAREMFPGRMQITGAEYARAEAVAAAPIGAARKYVEQIGALQLGAGPENLGPLYHGPAGSDAGLGALIELGRRQLEVMQEMARKSQGNTYYGSATFVGDRRRRTRGVLLQNSPTDRKVSLP